MKKHKTIDGIDHRECTRCKGWFPATSDYFHKNNAIKDGFCINCKDCERERKKGKQNYNAEYQRKYHELNREKINTQARDRRNANIEKERAKKKEYYLKNKETILAKHREKWHNDPEYRQKQNEWKSKHRKTEKGRQISKNAKHRRKARQRGLDHSLTFEQWEKIKSQFDFKCAYCGCEGELTRDHFVPLINGGEFSINNIIPACKHCNDSKYAKDFFEWYPQYEFYSPFREKRIIQFLGYDKQGSQQLQMIF